MFPGGSQLSDRMRSYQIGYLNVAAGLAVLAGIAASDAICCARLGCRHRGDSHRSAADVLRRATPDGGELAVILLRLLDLKDAAHYGVMIVAARKGRDALRWAPALPPSGLAPVSKAPGTTAHISRLGTDAAVISPGREGSRSADISRMIRGRQ